MYTRPIVDDSRGKIYNCIMSNNEDSENIVGKPSIGLQIASVLGDYALTMSVPAYWTLGRSRQKGEQYSRSQNRRFVSGLLVGITYDIGTSLLAGSAIRRGFQEGDSHEMTMLLFGLPLVRVVAGVLLGNALEVEPIQKG